MNLLYDNGKQLYRREIMDYVIYKDRAEELKKQLKIKKDRLARIMWMRLIGVLSGGGLSAVLFTGGYILSGWMALLASVVVFVGLVLWHHSVKDQIARDEAAQRVIKKYNARWHREFGQLSNKGDAFIDSTHPFAQDLDLFGKNSLYQWISVAYTPSGEKALAQLLKTQDHTIEEVKKRQKSVQELAAYEDFCLAFQTEGELSKRQRRGAKSLESYRVKSETKRGAYAYHRIGILTSIGFIASIIGTLFGFISGYIPLVLFIVQAGLHARVIYRFKDTLEVVYHLQKGLEYYRKRLEMMETTEFKTPLLQSYQKQVMGKIPASKAIGKLKQIGALIDIRHNPLIYYPLNICFQWDAHVAYATQRWEEQNGEQLKAWVHAIAQMEVLMSFAVVKQIHPNWSYPTLIDDQQTLEAEALGHPLIHPDQCVSNPVSMHKPYSIITGSNMSGKTTYLRTIGINLIMAYCGAPINGTNVTCSPMRIYTSMRIEDNLRDGISTFHAELNRIKTVIDGVREEVPMLYLIDEIFRGTNSVDRIIGAKSVLVNLKRPWVMGMMSTHDFELCDLADQYPEVMINKHFTEEYEEDRIQFDYRIRDGRSRTTNAKHLMRLVGIRLIETS